VNGDEIERRLMRSIHQKEKKWNKSLWHSKIISLRVWMKYRQKSSNMEERQYGSRYIGSYEIYG
jgi:hypothetical protein